MTAVIRPAAPEDVPLIFSLVRELAEYERLLHEVEATVESLAQALFGRDPCVFCDIAEWAPKAGLPQPAGFALWFYSFSTFRGRHGIYLEDLFVRPPYRGKGLGKALLAHLANRCVAEKLPGLEWHVLGWNEPSIRFYQAQGAAMLDEWQRFRLSGDALARLAGDCE